jgi:hypothetical protein
VLQILLRWRGSVYKLIYKELLAYIVMYMIINLTYRHGANWEFYPEAKFLVPDRGGYSRLWHSVVVPARQPMQPGGQPYA